ncbi:hypothetical protein MIT9_P0819 [Methylomarinovum caldicuralii]|uniref:YceK/YidQ family lipoprotein n=2 Tax=Methylomarinovum caldicuralii TaxID=438856 RepID=A0AAU9CI17_9GAMM|nr:hypothetical protein MIT9_P0819 [Methylomarinovum caldicuralii]
MGKTATLLVIAALTLFLAGCSSIRARDASPLAERTVYPGVRQDLREMAEIVTGQRREPVWIQTLVATILTADLPVSAVFDTLVLPYDLYWLHAPETDSRQ